MAAFDGTSFPAKFVVPGRVAKGAIVRAGCELDTALVETCMPGTEMEVVEVGTNAKGTTRYRLVKPVEGWVSDKSVEYVPPPEAEPADPTDDLEAFMAQSPITTKGAVLFKVEDGVGVVTFNQPENNNALSAAIFVGLMRRGAARNVRGTRPCDLAERQRSVPKIGRIDVDATERELFSLAPDGARPRRCIKYAYDHVGELRVIFIKSAGRIWCAGGDPKDFQAAQKMESEGRAADNSAGAQEFANRLKYVNECPVPVVALVAGPVFGGGVGICSVCDMVVCTERAAFQLSEVKLGVIPATISPYVVQAMGVRNARRYFTTGEPINAATAEAIGLASEVVKDVKGLEEAAQKICDNFTLAAPHAVAASKALVFGVGGKEITPELVDYTAAQLASIRVKGEAVVGMKALLAKQKPDWAKKPLKVKL